MECREQAWAFSSNVCCHVSIFSKSVAMDDGEEDLTIALNSDKSSMWRGI